MPFFGPSLFGLTPPFPHLCFESESCRGSLAFTGLWRALGGGVEESLSSSLVCLALLSGVLDGAEMRALCCGVRFGLVCRSRPGRGSLLPYQHTV